MNCLSLTFVSTLAVAALTALAQPASPGGPRPEHPVVPQFSTPIGRMPPASAEVPAAPPAASPAASSVDDRWARCEAQAGESQRALCRSRMARPPTASR